MTDNTINNEVTMRGDAPASGAKRFRAGDEILGRYVVESELGQGGMGVVYLCLDKVGGVKVAVKGLPPEVSHNADEMESVRDNFQLVSELHHPNIAGVRTLEKDSTTGDYYLVMSLARGVSLRHWLRQHGGREHRAEQLNVLRQIASALDYAHNAEPRHIIHRDILRHENVMVDEHGNVSVLDFGLAAQVRSSLSRVSQVVTSRSGTPAYKSPEQWLAQAQRAPSDQYSLGVIAYQMFAGELPYDSDDIEILKHAVVFDPVPEIVSEGKAVNAVFAKALAKKPQERFASCGDFIAALGGARAVVPVRKSRFAVVLLGALAVVALVCGWFWREKAKSDEQAAERARQVEIATREAERRKAENHLVPTLRFVAKIGDREVPATATFDGKPYTSPWRWEENVNLGTRIPTSDVSVEYTEGGKRYIGTINPVTVDWKGPKTVVVALTEHKEPKPGDTKTITLPGGATMEMVWCPPGSFMMGSPTSDDPRGNNETQHEVMLPQGFWMGKKEVSQGQWKSVMGTTVVDQARKALLDDTKYVGKTVREWLGKEKYDDPATVCGDMDDEVAMYYVSWEEANEYCKRLTERERAAGRLPEGWRYCLPTEAQWEYACRAQTDSPLPNGMRLKVLGKCNAPALDDIAWYGGNSSVGFTGRGWNTDGWPEKQYPGGRAGPRKGGLKEGNGFGLYDMIGNVWEWCADWYDKDYYGRSPTSDPTGPASGTSRVNRGGCWSTVARGCRSASRGRFEPGYRYYNLGFRLVCSPRIAPACGSSDSVLGGYSGPRR